MKKIRLYFPILAAALLLLCTGLTTEAAKGSNATGASLPQYKQIVTLTIDADDFEKSLKASYKEAEENATNEVQYKLVIPPGNHDTSSALKLYSNMHIYAVGATINATGELSSIFRSDSESMKNIVIEGGTWTTKKQTSLNIIGSTLLRLAHITNLHIKDAAFLVNRNGHIIEFSDAYNVTIERCKISGNNISGSLQPKEAIQLDISTEAAMPGPIPYNGKGCHNFIIRNNIFSQVARGVGSHNFSGIGVEKIPYSNITISENTFKSSTGEAVFIQFWRNATISKNKISNAHRAGIYLHLSRNNLIKQNTVSKTKMFTGERKKTYGDMADGIILNQSYKNKISKNKISSCRKTGIRIYLESSNNALTNNQISKCKTSGIFVEYSKTPAITANILKNNKGYGIRIHGKAYAASLKKLKRKNRFSKNKPGKVLVK